MSPIGDRRWFDAAPHGYVVLTPQLRIVDVNATFTHMTMTDAAQLIGRYVFDAFPDNPDDPSATGAANLAASLAIVLNERRMHRQQWQRYDIRDRDGCFVERYWAPINAPIFDDSGNVEFILHCVDDVTRAAQLLPGPLRQT
jgi:PAS domain S-box-containing protein